MTDKEVTAFLSSAIKISDPPGAIEFDAMIDAQVAAMTDEEFFTEINELRKEHGIPPFSSIEECLKFDSLSKDKKPKFDFSDVNLTNGDGLQQDFTRRRKEHRGKSKH